MIISDITEQLLPPQNITMEDLCISAFTSGVNPSFLWFGLGPFYLEFEVFSFFGQLSLNPQAGEDFEKYEILKSYLFDSITSPDNRGALWATRKSMMRFTKYMIYEHPAVATGRASPIVENAAVRLRGEPISIDVLFPRDVSKIV